MGRNCTCRASSRRVRSVMTIEELSDGILKQENAKALVSSSSPEQEVRDALIESDRSDVVGSETHLEIGLTSANVR
ncbi:hypothetical protein GcM1_172011 [Golovinomyces cichoracearum]|uniref:Uncharacterized protein n=1 Tax=Golovinomyces cichoracearum TaxID=62708 RepID=A0A420J6I0_9PEZI|nr:hypothetical protein GcM1_172011 [Golovinomyces cichoracearum]